jgi:hypothetical protein
MRALETLVQQKGRFSTTDARRTAKLLEQLATANLSTPEDLIVLHETLLYLCAYPQNARVLRLSRSILRSFQQRLRGFDEAAFADPEVSGMAGTAVSTNFSYEFARSLASRHGAELRIDWDNFARPDRLGLVLARLLPGAQEAWSVEPHVDWREWFESTGCTLQGLLDRIDAHVYDLLEIPLYWNLEDSTATRTLTWLPRFDVYYHQGPLLRRSDVSMESEFAAPKIATKKLSARDAKRIMDVIVDASAVRYRELWGFVHPDPRQMLRADFGRGVEFYFFGVPPEWRLPVRVYHCGMYFKNGVPIGYFEGLSLFEKMEAGFNLYYTFRDGETAWLYARTLKFCREQLGVTCFSIDPYQIGHENAEAIASGAFWFYRKLGFRPATEAAAKLAEREGRKLAANGEYRTPASVLRRLARSPMLYGGDRDSASLSALAIAKRADREGTSPWKMLGASREVPATKSAATEREHLRLLQRSAALRRRAILV